MLALAQVVASGMVSHCIKLKLATARQDWLNRDL